MNPGPRCARLSHEDVWNAGNREGAMAWYAKFDGIDGSVKDGTSNTLMLAEMDAFKFLPEKEDEIPVAFEFGDTDHNADGRDFLVWQRNMGSQPDGDGLSLPLLGEAPPQDAELTVPRTGKPSLVVKLDIGGPNGALEPEMDYDALASGAPASGPNAGAHGFFLLKQPVPVDYDAEGDAALDMIAPGEDADKPSLIVKFDIGGGPTGALE
jgi:hypothetical protein